VRNLLFALGALVVVAIVVLWPPAAVHIAFSVDHIQDRTTTIQVGMSYVRTAIFAVAFLTFVAALVYAVISALRHRT
jgi:hypothetical protein